MSYQRRARDAFMKLAGLIADGLAVCHIYASNNKFNGQLIAQYTCSKLLRDDMIICRFYIHETLMHHNFVVFQTLSRRTFKVHLIADFYPNPNSTVHVEIGPTYWKPDGRRVYTCYKRARDLKRFVQRAVRRFGTYEVGINDCRHFARAVAAFLTS